MHSHMTHAPTFVALSIIVAILGSWTALDLFRRAGANGGQMRMWWLLGAAAAMGLSIWSMHFIAMLGWAPGPPIHYDVGLTLLSLALPIFATGVAFFIAAKLGLSTRTMVLTGLAVGGAICLMHYVGMAAVRGAVRLTYDPLLVAASYLVAAVASTGALWAAGREQTALWRAVAAAILGLAIVSMHYTAMAALHVELLPRTGPDEGVDTLFLASWVAGGTLALLGLAIVAVIFDRRFEALAAREAEASRRSERQFRSVLDQMPVGVVIASPSGEVQFANAEVERLLGHQISAGSDWDSGRHLRGLHADGRPYAPDDYPLTRTLQTSARVDRELMRYHREEGAFVELEVSSAPILNEQGEAYLAVMALQDVTARREAEGALLQSQRMEAVGQLTGGIAHDFNNLLTAVLGNLALAQKRMDSRSIRPFLENATHAAKRGAALTAQLLAFSRRQKLKTEAVDLNTLIDRMGGLLSVTLGGAFKVNFRSAADLPFAVADPTQLELALLNLAINARDAMAAGGTLTITTGACVVDRQDAPHEPEPGDYVFVSVADTGTGMAPEVLARVFEPFFTTKPSGKGSGLGLSQVLGLTKQIGGGLRIDTKAGVGSTIVLYLRPAAAEAAELAVHTTTRPDGAEIAGALLVVDDDADVRRFLVDLLSGRVGRVESDESGLAAITRVRGGFRPDLTLLDIAMPEMSGVETARRLRLIEPDLPVLLMTGYADHDQASDLDGLQVLQKPFDPDALLDLIAKKLSQAS